MLFVISLSQVNSEQRWLAGPTRACAQQWHIVSSLGSTPNGGGRRGGVAGVTFPVTGVGGFKGFAAAVVAKCSLAVTDALTRQPLLQCVDRLQ